MCRRIHTHNHILCQHAQGIKASCSFLHPHTKGFWERCRVPLAHWGTQRWTRARRRWASAAAVARFFVSILVWGIRCWPGLLEIGKIDNAQTTHSLSLHGNKRMSETWVGGRWGGTENGRETNNECQNLTEEYFHGVCYFSNRANMKKMMVVAAAMCGGEGVVLFLKMVIANTCFSCSSAFHQSAFRILKNFQVSHNFT